MKDLNLTPEQNEKVLELILEIIGPDLELRGDIDDRLLAFVPDIEERRVDGVSPSFTNLYTRAIVNSTLEELRQAFRKAFGGNK